MPLPDQTPKLPKWPFLAGDAALLGVAGLIAANSRQPFSPEITFAIVASVIVATIAGAIPFLADYARRQDEALDERQRALESLAHTVSTAAEQISIAVRGFQEIADLAQRNLKQAEQLPQKLQDKFTESHSQRGAAADEEKEQLKKELAARRAAEAERLESAAEKIARAATDWVRLGTASQKQLAAVQAVLAELDEKVSGNSAVRGASLTKADSPAPAPAPPETSSAPEAPPAVAAKEEAAAMPDDLASVPPPADALPGVAAEAPAKAPRKRTPRKPPAETPILAVPPGASEPALFEPPPALEFSQTAADEASPATAIAADGATRLLVTAYIGIGNRLFIRGAGPGLSWDRGVPLQFVSIGKWRWETADATTPVSFKLYKNDEIECGALGSRQLEPGHQQDVTATF